MQRVIGIDPGSICCGYGIIDNIDKDRLIYVTSGIVNLPKKEPIQKRLCILYKKLKKILKEYVPDSAAIEKVFLANNVKTALNLGHSRGVILLSLEEEKINISEYTPTEVKKSLIGYGRADKNQIQKMVQQILNIKNHIQTDSADALALAICHIHSSIWQF